MNTFSGHWKATRLFSTAACALFCVAATCLAKETGETASPSEPRVVVRVAGTVLNSMMDRRDVDRETDVHEVILGTNLYGRARTTGTPGVKLIESSDKAMFFITLAGEVHSRATGYNGPAIIYSRAVTHFTATKLVVFEPGTGFRASPAKVSARTRTTIEGVDSARGGLIGRIVRRRASAIAASQQSMAQEIARQRAELRIQAAFNKASEQRLAKMNESVDLRAWAASAVKSSASGEPRYTCCTTRNYFQIAATFGDLNTPIELPVDHPDNPQAAPIEVWIHESLAGNSPLVPRIVPSSTLGERLGAGLELLNKQAENSNVLLSVTAAAKLLENSEALEKIPSLVGGQPFKLHKVGAWQVAKVDMPPQDVVNMVRALRPELAPQKSLARSVVQPRKPTAPALASRSAGEAPAKLNSGVASQRTWTSGNYTARARFLALDGDTVKLQRSSGVNTSIEFEKLSPPDQNWIRQYLAIAATGAVPR